jgi:GH18 family chitinase
MTSNAWNRTKFIMSLGKFLETWAFFSVELHWEWHGPQNRRGNPPNAENLIKLLKEMRAHYNPSLRISVVLPAQSEYLKNMDPKGMEASVDWFTLLSFDLHGPWDRKLTYSA